MRLTIDKRILFASVVLFVSWVYSLAGTLNRNFPTKKIEKESKAIQHTDDSLEHWIYQQFIDKMTSDTVYYAEVYAHETLQLKFPYDGGTYAALVIRYKDGVNNVYLKVSKGQFNIGPLESVNFRVRFDDNKPIYVRVDLPADDRSNIVFLHPPGKLIPMMKKAKKMLIEAQFFQDNSYVLSFNVSKLKWRHYDKVE